MICHVSPKGGIDDRIAQVLKGYTKEQIGTLRGLYDMDNQKPLVLIPEGANETTLFSGDEVLAAANELMKYKNQLTQKHLKEMNNSTTHIAQTFNKLYHVEGWNEATRRNRINMVAAEFTAEVSRRMQEAERMGIPVTREQIVNGYKSQGKVHAGQFDIFETIFNKLLGRYSNARKMLSSLEGLPQEKLDKLTPLDKEKIFKAQKIVQEYSKILQNWSALTTFARMSLRDIESLKLGATLEYASPTSPDNFVMDSPMEDYYNLEESVKEAWMQHTNQTSAFGSLGSEIRRFLSTITQVDEKDTPVKDDLGYIIRMDPVSTHRYLADILRGITTESGMVKKLYSLSKEDPTVKAVFDALAKASQADLSKSIDNANKPKNPTIITQLLIDMHKNLVPYSALVKNGAGKIIAKILNRRENPLESEFILRMQLNNQLSEGTSLYDKEGKVDWEHLAQWNVESEMLLPAPEKKETDNKNIFSNQTEYGNGTGFWSPDVTKQQRIEYMVRAAKAMGIPMTTTAATRIYNSPTQRKGFLTALQEFRTETRRAWKGDVRNDLNILESYWKNEHPTAEDKTKYQEALNRLKARNIRYNGGKGTWIGETYGGNQDNSKGAGKDRINKMLGALAAVSNNLKTERRISWFDRKGKAGSRYSDKTPSYMGDMVDKIHEFVEGGDAQGLRDFIMDKWGQSSFFYDKTAGRFLNKWLQEMYDSIRVDTKGNVIISPEAFAKVFQFDEFLGSNINKNVSIFENFTEKQHAEAMLKQFLQIRDDNSKSSLAKYPCFILGDSGAQMFFTAKRYSLGEILTGLQDVFQQELERIKYVEATNQVLEQSGYKTIDNFSQTANEFTMLKFLNANFENGKYWKILTGNDSMTDAEAKALSKEEAMQLAKEAVGTDALKNALYTYMQDSLDNFKKKLVSVGILKEVRGKDGAITYVDANNYFTQNLHNYKDGLEEMLEDFFWNTKYATIEQLQMFTVDPAFYDHRYPVKDLQKRYKEIYAPGKGVSTEARDLRGNLYMSRPHETAVYFDDIAVSSEDVNPYFMNLMKKTFGEDSEVVKAYGKNTLTDGQGYRSLTSYRAVKGMAGEWTPAMETAYQRIMDIRQSGKEIDPADIAEIAQLATNFQPIKPYLYTLEKLQINDQGDMALIPVQHKYAEVVLIPELMQEGKLKDIAVWMENNDVDLVASTKCVKVGAFGSVALKGLNTTEDIHAALDKAFIHKLPWADYRIQSGVPEHLNHAQLFGTQIRKLILANIDKGGDYQAYLKNIFKEDTDDPRGLKVTLPGMGTVYLTGRNLISFYNCLIMANLFDSYGQFAKETATSQDLSDKMIQNIISNANQSEDNAFGLSIIDEEGENEGEFVIPPGEPGMEHDASALMWSLFKKNVNKQKIKGGSAVQASALGLSGYEDAGDLFEVVSPDGNNVLYDEIEMPFNITYTSPTQKKVPLNFNDWCNPDGTLKMSDKIVYGEDAKEYLSWPVSGRDKHGKAIDASQGYYIPLIETKYPGVLDIIAYRIPTERDYSMINCKVFRFSNPLAGGTLKVPSSRTTTAGFDFDIDKLYFFMREFAQTHLSDRQIENIWNAIYDAHPEWKEALQNARFMDRKGQSLLGEITGMFSHSNEMADIANSNEKAAPERLYNYWEAAGLEGTPEEAFTKYLEDHRKEYPIFDTYNPQNSPLNPVKNSKGEIVTPGNTRAARNNMLIDLMRQRLMDEETLKARYTPGGFEANRDAALRMRVLQFADKADITTKGSIDWTKVDAYVQRIKEGEIKDPEPEYDVSDPTAILVYNQQNQVAGKLIGIFANQNTNHVYASTMQELRLNEPLYFGNHTVNGLSDMLHAPEGVDVDTNVAEYLAASVDAVKDPVLNFLNLNLTTADAGALLARIGYTPQEIGLLFNQPIIKDVCNYVANNNVSTDFAITEMLKKYGGQNATFKKFNFDASTVTTDRLANNILQSRTSEGDSNRSNEFRQGQLQVLWLFNELMADTADVNSFVQCTRFTAANSIGSTWGDQLAQEERVNKFIDKYMDEDNEGARLSFRLFDPEESASQRIVHVEEAAVGSTNQGILNIDESLLELSPEEYMAQMSRNPLAFEQCMMDLSRKTAKQLFNKYFPYGTDLYGNMRNVMAHLTKHGTLDADSINSLHREFMVYLLSKNVGSDFDGEAYSGYSIEGRNLSNREFYTETFPYMLHILKTEHLLDGYPFFEALDITGNVEKGESLKISVQGMGGLQTKTTSLLTEAWAEAFNSDAVVHSEEIGADLSVSELARGLYFYNFYKLGYNFHPTSSMSLAPTLLKLDLKISTDTKEEGYIDFIRDVISGNKKMDGQDLQSFAKQYILNHLDNKKFVFTPSGVARKAVSGAFNEKTNAWNDTFTLSYGQMDESVRSLFTIRDERLRGEKTKAFKPVLAIERDGTTTYYMADSSSELGFNISEAPDGRITYRRVYAQGIKGQQIQYFGHATFEAYQRDAGSLQKAAPSESILSSQSSETSESNPESLDSSTPPPTPEGTYIEASTTVADMFTEGEWKWMFDRFKQANAAFFSLDYMAGFGVEKFKDLILDTSDSQNVDILNSLIHDLNLKKKFKTIDEEGNEIDVC